VDKISGELRKEGKVPLLTGRERSFGFGNGRNQRFEVIAGIRNNSWEGDFALVS
jgi:hypothetical protein